MNNINRLLFLCLILAVAGCQKVQYPIAMIEDAEPEINYTVDADLNGGQVKAAGE